MNIWKLSSHVWSNYILKILKIGNSQVWLNQIMKTQPQSSLIISNLNYKNSAAAKSDQIKLKLISKFISSRIWSNQIWKILINELHSEQIKLGIFWKLSSCNSRVWLIQILNLCKLSSSQIWLNHILNILNTQPQWSLMKFNLDFFKNSVAAKSDQIKLSIFWKIQNQPCLIIWNFECFWKLISSSWGCLNQILEYFKNSLLIKLNMEYFENQQQPNLVLSNFKYFDIKKTQPKPKLIKLKLEYFEKLTATVSELIKFRIFEIQTPPNLIIISNCEKSEAAKCYQIKFWKLTSQQIKFCTMRNSAAVECPRIKLYEFWKSV